jgi:site-specific DNA-methyltransferase (adenine-specific)
MAALSLTLFSVFMMYCAGFRRQLSRVRVATIAHESLKMTSEKWSLPPVILGDSTRADTYRMARLGPSEALGLADVLVTDPPYCLLERRRKGGDLRDPKKRQRKLDDDDTVTRFADIKSYRQFTKAWMVPCIEHGLKKDAPLIIWTNVLGKKPIIDVCSELGYVLNGEYLWAKRTTTASPSPNSTKNEVLLRVYESALVFRKEPSPQLRPDDKEVPWSVITGYHDEESEYRHDHPCHKPFRSLEPLLRSWTRPGDLILDVFSGSGAILQAAVRIGGRRVVGIETLPQWAQRANEAIQMEMSRTKNEQAM